MVRNRAELGLLVLTVGVGGAVIAVITWLQRSSGPVLWDDEGTYLWVAAGFARGERWALIPGSPSYSATYSILLTPFVALAGQARADIGAMLLNASAIAALAVALWRLALDRFRLDPSQAAIVVLAALTYPALALQAPRAWAELVLMSLVVLVALAWSRFVSEPTIGRFVVLAASAALIFAVHRRMFGMLLLIPAAPLLVPVMGPSRRKALAAVGAALVPTAVFTVSLIDSLALPGTVGESRAGKVSDGLAPSQWLDTFTSILGQLWSVQVTTLGLAAVAIVGGVLIAPSVEERRWSIGLSGVFAVSLVITSLFLRTSLAVDHVFYTRYLDAFGPFLVAWGVSLLLRRVDASTRVWEIGAAIVLVGLPLIRLFRIDVYESPVVKIRIVGLLGSNAIIRDYGAKVSTVVEVAAISGLLIGVVALGVFFSRRTGPMPVAVGLVAINATLGLVAAHGSLGPWLNIAEPTGASAAELLRSEGVDEVTVVPIGDAGPVARAVAFQSGYTIRPVPMPYSEISVGCPSTRFVLIDPDLQIGFEAKQVGDGRPFRTQLLEVVSCP